MSKGPLPPDKSLSAAARTSHSLQGLAALGYNMLCAYLHSADSPILTKSPTLAKEPLHHDKRQWDADGNHPTGKYPRNS
jgi:hypothetical protein